MTAKAIESYTRPLVPDVPQPAVTKRLVWLLSAHGRARLRLLKAHHRPADQQRRNAFINALQKIRSSTEARSEPVAELVRDGLVFLAWSAMEARAPRESAKWIAELDRECPKSMDRIHLRWDLMNRLLAVAEFHDYMSQASNFLKDPAVAACPDLAVHTRLTRILVGAPRVPKNDGGPMTALEAAMHFLFFPGYEGNAEDLERRLREFRSDPLYSGFPPLVPVVDVLILAISALSPRASEADTLVPSAPAVPWANWLFVRQCLQRADSARDSCWQRTRPGSSAGPDIDSDLAVAWALDCWWSLYGLPGASTPPEASASRQRLGTAIGQLPADIKSVMSFVCTMRAGMSADDQSKALTARKDTYIWDLTGLCGIAMLAELEFERAYWRTRSDEGVGRSPRKAAKAFGQLLERLPSLPRVSNAMLGPAVMYRHAIALAETDPPKAQAALEDLLQTPVWREARTQLAMLAIKDGDLDAAGAHLNAVTESFPASDYARALLDARLGNSDSALQRLESLGNCFSSVDSPYLVASKRLASALEERRGNLDQSESISRKALSASPGDPVLCARLGRLLVMRGWQTVIGGKHPSNTECEGMLQTAAEDSGCGVEWSRPYWLLHQLMICPADDLPEMRSRIVPDSGPQECSLPMLQLSAHRLLGARQAAAALQMQQFDDSLPEYLPLRRTHLILKAWHLLSQGRSSGNPSRRSETDGRRLADCVAEMTRLCGDGRDDVTGRWRFLMVQACRLEATPDGTISSDLWKELSPWPISPLPGLWAEDEADRTRAAEAVKAVVESGEFIWSEEQTYMINAMIAHASGDEDAFLEHYTYLEPVIDDLPVAGRDLWMTAARLWFKRRNWRQLLESDMPDCVADLSDPEVRLAIALSYACSAIDEKDARKALSRIRQARTNLEPLVEAAGQE